MICPYGGRYCGETACGPNGERCIVRPELQTVESRHPSITEARVREIVESHFCSLIQTDDANKSCATYAVKQALREVGVEVMS